MEETNGECVLSVDSLASSIEYKVRQKYELSSFHLLSRQNEYKTNTRLREFQNLVIRNRVLDKLRILSILQSDAPPNNGPLRKALEELITTERDYVMGLRKVRWDNRLNYRSNYVVTMLDKYPLSSPHSCNVTAVADSILHVGSSRIPVNKKRIRD